MKRYYRNRRMPRHDRVPSQWAGRWDRLAEKQLNKEVFDEGGMDTLLVFLSTHAIPFERFDHPAVFTCEESEKLPPFPGASTKNLFLRDEKKQNYFLVSVGHEKRVDMKALAKMLDATKLSFGDAEHLKKFLGVDPGSVTIFGAMFDAHHTVDIIIDHSVWEVGKLQCHPLVNTATLVIKTEDLDRFFHVIGHPYRVMEVPGR